MTMRRAKRYTLQTFKEKEQTGNDPYSMRRAPKGVLQCPECQAVYYRKRWILPGTSSSGDGRTQPATKKTGKAVQVPQPYICPACRKLRDRYAEGFVTIYWPNWIAHQTDVLNLIHNEEARAREDNPLARIMNIRTRPDGIDIETTTEKMAQRIGQRLRKAYHGDVQYNLSHKDKLARIEWKGPVEITV